MAEARLMEMISRAFIQKTLDEKCFSVDASLAAVLDEYGDLFAYVLKTEGWFVKNHSSSLTFRKPATFTQLGLTQNVLKKVDMQI